MARVMKNSGIEWIGDIPERWEVSTIKRNFYVINGSTPKSDNNNYWTGNIVWITPAEMAENIIEIYDSKRTITEEGLQSCGTTLIPPKSIIVSNRAPIGQVCIAGVELCTNQGCKSLVSKKYIYERYYYYYLVVQSNTLNMLGRGTTFLELSTFDLANFKIPFPPILEQQAIADFLDRKRAIIDSTIEKQKAVIEKLKFYKQSVITEAVTKGLDPTAKIKPSGIEWIGDISEGWELRKLNGLLKTIGSGTTPKGNDSYYDGDILWLNTGDLNDGYIYKVQKSVTQLAVAECSALKVFPEDSVVIAMYGATIGKLGITTQPLTTNQACCVMSCDNNLINKYLFYWLLGNKEFIITLSYGAGQPNISQEVIKQLRVTLPPLSEQQAIADYLDVKCAGIDNVINGKQKLIEKLSDYKKSLIYECVTGKREVM